jgi:hypothetical protein
MWAPTRNLPLLRHIAPVRSFTAVRLDLLEIDPPRALIERLRAFDEIVSWYGAAREEFAAAALRRYRRELSAVPGPAAEWRGMPRRRFLPETGGL